MGYRTHPGGKWSGDFYVLDAENLNHADGLGSVYIKTVKDIIVPKVFTFPVADGVVSQPEDRCRQQCLEEEEDDDDQCGSQEPLFPPLSSQSAPDTSSDGASFNSDFWSMSGEYLVRHHIFPREHLYSPGDDCPFPIKWLDVHRETNTNFEASEKHIKDYWDGSNECDVPQFDYWVGYTKFSLVYPSPQKRGVGNGYYGIFDQCVRKELKNEGYLREGLLRPEEIHPLSGKT